MGCIIGPLVGGFLSDQFEFQITCDIMGVSCMVYAFLYFAFLVIPKWREDKNRELL